MRGQWPPYAHLTFEFLFMGMLKQSCTVKIFKISTTGCLLPFSLSQSTNTGSTEFELRLKKLPQKSLTNVWVEVKFHLVAIRGAHVDLRHAELEPVSC